MVVPVVHDFIVSRYEQLVGATFYSRLIVLCDCLKHAENTLIFVYSPGALFQYCVLGMNGVGHRGLYETSTSVVFDDAVIYQKKASSRILGTFKFPFSHSFPSNSGLCVVLTFLGHS